MSNKDIDIFQLAYDIDKDINIIKRHITTTTGLPIKELEKNIRMDRNISIIKKLFEESSLSLLISKIH